jgi:hypothetical protein
MVSAGKEKKDLADNQVPSSLVPHEVKHDLNDCQNNPNDTQNEHEQFKPFPVRRESLNDVITHILREVIHLLALLLWLIFFDEEANKKIQLFSS